jgi:2'-5' RNA ligase
MSSPTLFYRATGHLNRTVWRMPLPHRVLARLSKIAYRNPPMSLEAVEAIIDALEGAEVRFWLWGGWGVDALSGAQSRTHRDLDLVLDARHIDAATGALALLGYSEWYRIESDRPMHGRVVLHDHELAGRAVDLHPVDLEREQLAVTQGRLGARPVPCLAPELQLSTHTGYRPRRQDRLDLAALRRVLTRPASTLIVPVPAAAELLDESAREAGMPPHITLVYPFIPAGRIDGAVEAELASVLGATAPFEFRLERVGRFPGVVYLAPEPAEPFAALVQALLGRWPEHPPYGGEFEELVPHLTVAYGAAAPAGVEEALPLEATAREVWLMTRTPGAWVPRARFPLGGGHAA